MIYILSLYRFEFLTYFDKFIDYRETFYKDNQKKIIKFVHYVRICCIGVEISS